MLWSFVSLSHKLYCPLSFHFTLPNTVSLLKLVFFLFFFKAQLSRFISLHRNFETCRHTHSHIHSSFHSFISSFYPINEKADLQTESSLPLLPPRQKSLPQQKQRKCFPKNISISAAPIRKLRKCGCKTRGAIAHSLSPYIEIKYMCDIIVLKIKVVPNPVRPHKPLSSKQQIVTNCLT